MQNINEFRALLEKYKPFRVLPDQYKNIKFCKLYYKMYKYMLSIPKEKIDIVDLVRYINFFLKAKDFYHWKDRIYSLLTEKLGATSKRKYKLLYRSKAEEFLKEYSNLQKEKSYNEKPKEEKDKINTKRIFTIISKPKEEKDKIASKKKNTWKSKSKEELDKMESKRKDTCINTLGVDNPMRSKEVQEKFSNTLKSKPKEEKDKIASKKKNTWKSKSKEELDNIVNKRENTCLEIYGVEYGFMLNNTAYSTFGNEVCTAIDNLLGNPEDSIYYIKSGYEYCIHTDTKNYYIDMVIPSLGLAFEVDGCYWHGLLKDQEYVKGTPVEEIHKRDKEKTEAIEKSGYKLFRIREDEYKKDPKGTIEKLLEQIRMYLDISQIHQVAQ